MGPQLSEPRAFSLRDFVLGQGPPFGDHGIAIGFAHNSRAARPSLDRMAGTDKDEVGLAVRGSIFSRRDQAILATVGSALTADGEKLSRFRLGHSANSRRARYAPPCRSVPAGDGRETDGFIYKLEHPDGTPADPPAFKSAAGTAWNVGDPLYLGTRTLRVVDTRLDESIDGDPVAVLIVEAA